MTILPRETERATVLHMVGSMGARDLSRLHRHLAGLLASRKTRIVLDFSDVDHVDYQDAGELAKEFEFVRSYRGELTVAGLSPYVRNILLLAGLHGFLEMSTYGANTHMGPASSHDLQAS
jgi:anti-anti-sigma factor